MGPDEIRPRRRSGHPSFTRVSCNMTTKNAPASGIVAGKVGELCGLGVASKIPRRLAWPTHELADEREGDAAGDDEGRVEEA